MALRVHRSNVLPGLAEALADRLAEVGLPEDPLQAVTIAVPARGIEDWLVRHLADRFGVWTPHDFPFPRALLERLLVALLGPADPAAAVFDVGGLAFAVLEVLPGLLSRPAFAPLAGYLGEAPDLRRRLELARQVARLLDRYAVYRADDLLEWQRRPAADDWQAQLFQALVDRHGPHHLPARVAAALGRLAARSPLPGTLPSALHLFGFRALPPLHLRLLSAVAERVPVDLYVLTVTREWVAEAASGDAPDDTVHPLLLTSGRLHREWQRVLEASGAYEEPDGDRFRDPGTGPVLHALQSDLLHARRRGLAPGEAPPLPADAADESLVVHACASPLRELEVVRERLLAACDLDPSLAPHELPVADPVAVLEDLVALEAAAARVPLRFFPAASLAYARRADPPDRALVDARAAFALSGDEGAADPGVVSLHAGVDPLAAGPGLGPEGELDEAFGFSALAVRVFRPLLDHLSGTSA